MRHLGLRSVQGFISKLLINLTAVVRRLCYDKLLIVATAIHNKEGENNQVIGDSEY